MMMTALLPTTSGNGCKLVRNQLLLPNANYLARYLTRYFEQEHCRGPPACLARYLARNLARDIP